MGHQEGDLGDRLGAGLKKGRQADPEVVQAVVLQAERMARAHTGCSVYPAEAEEHRRGWAAGDGWPGPEAVAA